MIRSHTYGSIACFMLVCLLCSSQNLSGQEGNKIELDSSAQTSKHTNRLDLKPLESAFIYHGKQYVKAAAKIDRWDVFTTISVVGSQYRWRSYTRVLPSYVHVDTLAIGGSIGFDVHFYLSDKKRLFIGERFYYSNTQGQWRLGPGTPGGKEVEVLGRYRDQAINHCTGFGFSFNARNAILQPFIGLSHYFLPNNWNYHQGLYASRFWSTNFLDWYLPSPWIDRVGRDLVLVLEVKFPPKTRSSLAFGYNASMRKDLGLSRHLGSITYKFQVL